MSKKSVAPSQLVSPDSTGVVDTAATLIGADVAVMTSRRGRPPLVGLTGANVALVTPAVALPPKMNIAEPSLSSHSQWWYGPEERQVTDAPFSPGDVTSSVVPQSTR